MRIREAYDAALGLMRREKFTDALVVLNDMLNVRPDDGVIFFLIGTCHRKLGHDALAYALFLTALEYKPDLFEAKMNLFWLLQEQGRHEEQLAILKECEELRPDDPDVVRNFASAYLNNQTPEIAEGYTRKTVEMVGERPDLMIQLGMSLLEQERFGEGFDAMDKALTLGERKTRNFWALGETPMWDGTSGQNVMVYGEQGHGDEIMFASCMREVITMSNQVFIDTSKGNMIDLYTRSFPDAIVFCTPDSQLKPYHTECKIDAAIPFGSLPTLFRRDKDQFPLHDGYLTAHPARKKEMRRRLDELGEGLKIGIAWRGGTKKTNMVNRTVGLEEFQPILHQTGAHFISLQYTPDAAGEADSQQDITGVPVHHWQAAITDFEMLTALIDEVDLVISVPQTAVHQRAALGKECWVLTPHKTSWTFGLEGEDSVWYPKQVRQFRQTASETKLTGAITRCALELSKRTGSKPGSVYIPEPVISEVQIQSPQC